MDIYYTIEVGQLKGETLAAISMIESKYDSHHGQGLTNKNLGFSSTLPFKSSPFYHIKGEFFSFSICSNRTEIESKYWFPSGQFFKRKQEKERKTP